MYRPCHSSQIGLQGCLLDAIHEPDPVHVTVGPMKQAYDALDALEAYQALKDRRGR